jgi:hypothetical protein
MSDFKVCVVVWVLRDVPGQYLTLHFTYVILGLC